MKTAVVALITTLFLASALAQSQVGSVPYRHCSVPADDAALRHVAQLWRSDYNSGNSAQVAALYADDATYLTQHFATGIVHGRANIQAYVQRGVDAHYRIDSIQVVSTECAGDFAYTITRYESTNAGQKAFGVNLVVLQRVNGKWLIVAHESAVPDPATAIQQLGSAR